MRGDVLWGNHAWHTYIRRRTHQGRLSFIDLLEPEDQHDLTVRLAGHAPFTLELRLRSGDNLVHWFRVHGQPQRSSPDGRSTWVLTGVDIDDLQAERQRSAQLQAIVDASASCVKILDLDSHLLWMNQGGMATMEIDDFDVCRNLLWLDFWEGDTRAVVEDAINRARGGEHVTFEAARTTFKGTPKWWEISITPLYNAEGRIDRLSAVSRDITASKAAQEAVAALDAFVAFSEIAGVSTDVLLLALHAVAVLRSTLGDVTVAYYTLHGDLWKAQVWSDDLAPEITAVLAAGIPVTAPSFAQALETAQPVFVAGWDADAQGCPYRGVRRGRVLSLFRGWARTGAAGHGHEEGWSPQ
ncbi:PAS domain-containing protein [Deinococcus malanensis]|uniref:PAS domain-containing protein n=1 Tax=Deinococcus malanensis TaxID=1706855 RepID=UPI0036402AA7